MAREGEAYLRARGHEITAGRLYLCHFLGMEGANKVLSSPASSSLVDVLGVGVIKANPFLTGRDVSYVIGWAEKKMRSRGSGASAPAVPRAVEQVREASPEFQLYKAAISKLLESATGTL